MAGVVDDKNQVAQPQRSCVADILMTTFVSEKTTESQKLDHAKEDHTAQEKPATGTPFPATS
jgi:hypothetical protein